MENQSVIPQKGIVMNYIGSKLSLMDFILDNINHVYRIKNGVFADLFAGTGVVGAEFRKRGFDVIANDIQYYSYVLIKHYIENSESSLEGIVEYLNSLDGTEGFVFKNFCMGSGSNRNYFTDENGKKCDAIRREIDVLYNERKISINQYYSLLACLINSIDKYANTASVYGAFLKQIKKSAAREFKMEILPEIYGPEGKAYNEDINELVKRIKGDILYLDPPYNARQYCTNYHVLETIARYDEPVLKGKTGLRDYNSQKSSYCSSKTVATAFEELISNADFKYIFLSYNNEGLMPLEVIQEIMKKYGKYEVFTKEYHRFRADKEESRNHKASSTTEFLHCLIK